MRRLLAIGLVLGAGLGASMGVEEGPKRIEEGVIENLFRLSPGLYSGGQPEGEEAFRALADLGVRTIVSVDGATPDVERAAEYGLRYVHLPVGYDGIPKERVVALAKVITTLPGPIFVHCHHGKHRGPAAAAVCGMVSEGWNRDQARRWLELAGTADDYSGLYASVDRFVPPTAEDLAAIGEAELPERAEVPDLVGGMVEIDARWERLKDIAAAGFRAPSNHPDLDPSHEATMLAEHYRELARLDESKDRGETFLTLLDDSERNALELRNAIQGPMPDRDAASAAFQIVARDCKTCHFRFRDRLP